MVLAVDVERKWVESLAGEWGVVLARWHCQDCQHTACLAVIAERGSERFVGALPQARSTGEMAMAKGTVARGNMAAQAAAAAVVEPYSTRTANAPGLLWDLFAKIKKAPIIR